MWRLEMENDYYGVVYKITNLVNERVYIGQTIQKPQRRWSAHKYNAKQNNPNNMYITKAIMKYGHKNFTFEVIDYAKTAEELNVLEGEYISSFNSLAPNGYNLQEYVNGKLIWPKKNKPCNFNKKKPNNTSEYHGVSLIKRDNIWRASTKFKKKNIHIGCFDTEIEAAQARDIEILKDKYFGLYELNFPELKEQYLNNEIVVLRRKDKPKINTVSPDIYFNKEKGLWIVLITHNTNLHYVGTFNNEEIALKEHKSKLKEFGINSLK